QPNINLVLVSIENAQTDHWKQALSQLHLTQPVSHIFVDEAHYALTSIDFREAFEDIHTLRHVPAQLVLLSATVPPVAEDTIIDMFGLSIPTHIIRTSTNRPEIRYIVDKPSSRSSIIERVQILVTTYGTQFKPEDRGLIYVPYKDQGMSLARILRCGFYHGGKDMDDEERLEEYQAWIRGTNPFMVCTSAFAAGNDYPHVRLVIHALSPWEMIDYVQSSARAGRDHRHAIAWMLPDINKPRPVSAPDHKGVQAMSDLTEISITPKPPCIRSFITYFCDGQEMRCDLEQASSPLAMQRTTTKRPASEISGSIDDAFQQSKSRTRRNNAAQEIYIT
ncbi:hypothetical protein EUX98_g9802, partial [Antrodiella citrinella]